MRRRRERMSPGFDHWERISESGKVEPEGVDIMAYERVRLEKISQDRTVEVMQAAEPKKLMRL
jgi:hypothetical protein